ncbi:exoribonuclease R [Escherichia coli]|nr:exoribonuclease R [Escherichia coli]
MVPDDSRLSFDILIPPDQIMGARMGFVVVVELTQRPTRRTQAVGKIVEVLGDNMGTGQAVDIARRHQETRFPDHTSRPTEQESTTYARPPI